MLSKDQIIDLSLQIALRRKKAAMSSKGRKFTPRACRLYFSSGKARADVFRLIQSAAEFAQTVVDESGPLSAERFDALLFCFLIDEFLATHRNKGPSRRMPGIISSAATESGTTTVDSTIRRGPGRPAILSPIEEKSWANRVLMIKRLIVAEGRKIKSYDEYSALVSQYPTIEREVTDKRAIEELERVLCDERGERFNPRCMPRLIGRLKRAKRSYELHGVTTPRKVGVNSRNKKPTG